MFETVIPPEIKEYISDGRLVVFAGAGCSKLCDCKSWAEMSHELVQICQSKELISYRVAQHLINEKDRKKVITICKNLLKGKNQNAFWSCIKKCLKPNRNKLDRFNIYPKLRYLNPKGLFVTTNIDELFSKTFNNSSQPNVFYDIPKDSNNLKSGALYHIHGAMHHDKRDVVLTVNDYLRRYGRSEEKIADELRNFLESIFSEYGVLFIGYGLEEYEILDFLLMKFKKGGKTPQQNFQHHILLPFYQGDEEIKNAISTYYRELGIKVIPYSIEKNGYRQLLNIVEDWCKQVHNQVDRSFEMVRHADDVKDELLGEMT